MEKIKKEKHNSSSIQERRISYQELMKTKGEVSGVVFQTDAKYVLEKKGPEGLKKLQKKVKELGLEIPYDQARIEKKYPFGLRIVSLLLIKDTFGWTEKEITDMGYTAPKTSFMIKLLMKHFLSVEKFAEKVPLFWKKHYGTGKLEIIYLKKTEKEMLVRLTDIKLHPVFCAYLNGYFEKMVEFVVGKSKCKLNNCVCEDKVEDSYMEHICNWKNA